VEDRPRHAVPALAPIELREDTAAIRLVIQIVQHYVELDFKHASNPPVKSNQNI
jgi:hypothetical protein